MSSVTHQTKLAQTNNPLFLIEMLLIKKAACQFLNIKVHPWYGKNHLFFFVSLNHNLIY